MLDPEFEDVSYGYREGRSVDQAVRRIMQLRDRGFRWVVDADIERSFDEIPIDKLLERLARHVDEEAVLALVRLWLTAEVREGAGGYRMSKGVAQGSPISPILANVYLHYALDLWFENVVKRHVRGEAVMCRYADDFVCAFRFEEDAASFYRVLPKRLGKFGLEVAPEKTRVLRFSRFHPSMKRRFTFLGFELYWFPDRQGEMRVKYRTSRKKLQGACRRIKDWIRDHRHLKGKRFIKGITTTTGSGATANLSTASTSGPSSVRSNGSTAGRKAEKLYLGSVRKEHWTD